MSGRTIFEVAKLLTQQLDGKEGKSAGFTLGFMMRNYMDHEEIAGVAAILLAVMEDLDPNAIQHFDKTLTTCRGILRSNKKTLSN